MRKIFLLQIIIAFALCFNSTRVEAQHWQQVSTGLGIPGVGRTLYADTVNDFLYVGGDFKYAGGDTVMGTTRWDGTQFSRMGCGFDWDCVSTPGFHGWGFYTRYHNQIYAGAGFNLADNKPIKNIAKWDGTTWDSLAFCMNDPEIYSLSVFNDELYITGAFDSVAGMPANGIAKWNGTAWSDVHNMPKFSPVDVNLVFCSEMFNGQLYVGGNFNNTPGMEDIVRWDGTQWTDVGGGLHGGASAVKKMLVYNNELYVAGTFSKADSPLNPGLNIARWNGTQWNEVGGGVGWGDWTPTDGQIYDMVIYHNKLYVVGQFAWAGGIWASGIAAWDGTDWCGFGDSIKTAPQSVAVFRDTIYITGTNLMTINGDTIHGLAKWMGGNFVDACGNTTGVKSEIQKSETEIFIYPNPTSGKFTVSSSEKIEAVEIYNVLGEKIFNSETSLREIDISKQPTGMYFLSARTKDKNLVNKILKQ